MFESIGIDVYATCPPSSRSQREEYGARVAQVARWSEDAGCRGILVYTDNSLVDPWLLSQLIRRRAEAKLAGVVAASSLWQAGSAANVDRQAIAVRGGESGHRSS